jgi:hypothetical protein
VNTHGSPPDARARLLALLEGIESAPPPVARATSPGPAAGPGEGGLGALEAAVAALIAEEGALPGFLARRAAQARDRLLLARAGVVGGRAADSWLAGLATSVEAAIASRGSTRWQPAALSESFLEAPRHLVLWRRTAVAACAVAALGLGLVATQHGAGGPAGSTPRIDPRSALLQPLGDDGAAGRFAALRSGVDPGGLARPVGWSSAPGGRSDRGTPRYVRILPLRPGGEVDIGRILDELAGPRPAAAPTEAWSERN